MKYFAEPYQEHATQHLIENQEAGLFIEMGLGKTVITLSAFIELKRRGLVKTALVIAPKAVAMDTWADEIKKWDHTQHLKVSKILGNPKERTAALEAKADIYTINVENVPWLILEIRPKWPFDYVVLDELSKFKSAKSKRFKALRTMRPKMKYVVGLTGTPMPNSLLDLWSQMYLIDQGKRLGESLTDYRDTYFKVDKMNGPVVYSYKLKKADPLLGEDIYAAEIYNKIGDICISMKAKDYIELPEKIFRNKVVHMDPVMMAKYEAFEEELIMEVADEEITVANAAVLSNKLLQFSNGAVYDNNKKWHQVHDDKLNALFDIVEEAQGAPVLVFYNFKHDLERIQAAFKTLKPRLLTDTQSRTDWNDGKIQLGLAHAASLGHGVNLQAGGNIIIWFGINWSLELYLQANARLHRRGQLKPVIIHHLVTAGTMDFDVLDTLERKDAGQNGLMRAVRARVQYYKMKRYGDTAVKEAQALIDEDLIG